MSQNKDNQLDQVTLTTEVIRQDDELVFEYQVVNGRSESIFLLNRLYKWTDSGMEIDPNLMFTELIDNGLRLSKAFIPVPDDVLVEMPDVPYLSEVPAKETYSEQITLPLPLSPWHPYDKVPETDTIHTFDGAELAIGWLNSGEFTLRQGILPDGQSIKAVNHREAETAQRLLTAAIPAQIAAAF